MKCCRCASGELIRCYLLTHWNDLRLSLGFASAAVERVIDGFWLLVAFVITATLVKGMPEDLVILVQILGALLRDRHHRRCLARLAQARGPRGVEESRWSATLRHVVEGLHLMGNRADAGADGADQPAVSRAADVLRLCADEGVQDGLLDSGWPPAC